MLRLCAFCLLLLLGTIASARVTTVLSDPGNLSAYASQIDTVLYVQVTGSVQGAIYGTDSYTADSPLAVAAVHAGLLGSGATGVVKVSIASQTSYRSSSRNGITSLAYDGTYPGYTLAADDGGETTITGLTNMLSLRHQPGTYQVRVTGDRSAGTVWGMNTYTDDTPLAAAAVHTGLLAHGQTAILRVTLLGSQSSFIGCEWNGVTSLDYGAFDGSYKLADSKGSTSIIPTLGTLANPYPATLHLQGQRGRNGVFYVRTTAQTGGSVYGTNIYTDDSTLATVVIHAGILSAGQTGIVAVSMLAGQPAYTSTTRNGITSFAYGAFAGSYSVSAVGATPTTPDTTPDNFSFSAISGVAPETVTISNSITVTGINTATPISISGGEYALDSGAYTNQAGTVFAGQKVTLRVTSAAAAAGTVQANLDIGGVTAGFVVSTRNYTRLSNAAELLNTVPSGASIDSNGVLVVASASATPLTIKAGATANALIKLPRLQQVALQGNADLTYTDLAGSSVLQTRSYSVSGVPRAGLEISSGTVRVGANGAALVPLTLDGNGTALATTGSGTLLLNRGRTGKVAAYVSAGVAGLRSGGNGFAATGETRIYDGETLLLDAAGAVEQIRLGSLDDDEGRSGDRISNIPGLTSAPKIPSLSGTPTRVLALGKTLKQICAEAIGSLVGGNVSNVAYDTSRGVLSFTAGNKRWRINPLGDIRVDLGKRGNQFAASSSTGAYELAASGLVMSFSTSLAYYDELLLALQGYDPTATISLLDGGIVRAQMAGAAYILQPSADYTQAITASALPLLGTNSAGYFTFQDSTGAVQVLYPMFASIAQLYTAFNPPYTDLGVVSNANGTATASIGGVGYVIAPDYTLISAPLSRANDLWWQDGSKLYVRYPQDGASPGTAQGFVLK